MAESSERPLIQGWVRLQTPDFKYYYYNEKKEITVWDYEETLKDLPTGWIPYADDDGDTYYFHEETQTTVWTLDDILEAMQAEQVTKKKQAPPAPSPLPSPPSPSPLSPAVPQTLSTEQTADSAPPPAPRHAATKHKRTSMTGHIPPPKTPRLNPPSSNTNSLVPSLLPSSSSSQHRRSYTTPASSTAAPSHAHHTNHTHHPDHTNHTNHASKHQRSSTSSPTAATAKPRTSRSSSVFDALTGALMGGHARGNSKVKASTSRKNSNSTKESISLRLRRLSQKRLHGISVPTLSEFHDQPLDILVVSWNVGNKVVSKFFFFSKIFLFF